MHDVHEPVLGRVVDREPTRPGARRQVGMGLGVEQDFHCSEVVVLASDMQRCKTVLFCEVRVCVAEDQQFDDLWIVGVLYNASNEEP